MSDLQQDSSGVLIVRAADYVDAEGSVVRSSLSLAEAVLKALDGTRTVKVVFEGLKGASSSYFNVFLRRLEEGCGIAEIGRHIQLEFGSGVQKMIYDRSLESVRKGPRPRIEPEPAPPQPLDPAKSPWRKRILGF